MADRMNKAEFDKMTAFLMPHFEIQQNRLALVGAALRGSRVLNQIDWSGNANTFTVHLLMTIEKFGESCTTRLYNHIAAMMEPEIIPEPEPIHVTSVKPGFYRYSDAEAMAGLLQDYQPALKFNTYDFPGLLEALAGAARQGAGWLSTEQRTVPNIPGQRACIVLTWNIKNDYHVIAVASHDGTFAIWIE